MAPIIFRTTSRQLRDNYITAFYFAPDNSISPVHYNLPFSYRNYKIFYNFNYSPPDVFLSICF